MFSFRAKPSRKTSCWQTVPNGCDRNCKVSGADDSPSSPQQQFHGVGRWKFSPKAGSLTTQHRYCATFTGFLSGSGYCSNLPRSSLSVYTVSPRRTQPTIVSQPRLMLHNLQYFAICCPVCTVTTINWLRYNACHRLILMRRHQIIKGRLQFTACVVN